MRPTQGKAVSGVEAMEKVFAKVLRTLKRPYPLMPSLESMLFNDPLTPKRYAVMSIISSTHRRQNRSKDVEDDDEAMDDDDEDIFPEKAKEYIRIIKQTNISDVLDPQPFSDQ